MSSVVGVCAEALQRQTIEPSSPPPTNPPLARAGGENLATESWNVRREAKPWSSRSVLRLRPWAGVPSARSVTGVVTQGDEFTMIEIEVAPASSAALTWHW